jgi:WD40 repeat protein
MKAAAGSGDGDITVWDLATRTITHTLSIEERKGAQGAIKQIRVITFDAAATKLAAAAGKAIFVWDLATSSLVIVREYTMSVWIVCFNDSGEHILSGARGMRLLVWSVATGDVLFTLSGTGLVAAFYSADYSRIVTASSSAGIKYWDPRTGACIGGLVHTENETIRAVHQNPAGDKLAIKSRDLSVWDVAQGTKIATVRHSMNCVLFERFPTNDLVVIDIGDTAFLFWNVANDTVREVENTHIYKYCIKTQFNVLVGGEGETFLALGTQDGTVNIHDTQTGDMQFTLNTNRPGYISSFTTKTEHIILM